MYELFHETAMNLGYPWMKGMKYEPMISMDERI